MHLFVGVISLSLIGLTSGYDFIRDALQAIDQNTDPCDNFFRHVCPEGDYKHLISEKYQVVLRELYSNQRDSLWKNLEFQKALKSIKTSEESFDLIEYYLYVFNKQCENGFDTTGLLERLQHLKQGSKTDPCFFKSCLTLLAKDTNCTRATDMLAERLGLNQFTTSEVIDQLKLANEDFLKNIDVVNAVVDGDLREGIRFIEDLVEGVIEVAARAIEDTPWVRNNGVEEYITELVREIDVSDNYAVQLRTNLENLFTLESDYLKCMQHVDREDQLFCLLYTSSFSQTLDLSAEIGSNFNAFNGHPHVLFSFPLYHMATYSEELAGKLGLIGMLVGHEVGHTIIENPNERELLPVSSVEAVQCIQDQYNATCQEFKESACEVSDIQIDENGSDILGLQLALQIFADSYEDMEDGVYMQLATRNITFQQLFFYAAALTHCTGTPSQGFAAYTHSAGNIRANVMAQHPAFKEAFECSDDSRMMRTVEKTCAIYGEEAPESKKKKIRKFSRKFSPSK